MQGFRQANAYLDEAVMENKPKKLDGLTTSHGTQGWRSWRSVARAQGQHRLAPWQLLRHHAATDACVSARWQWVAAGVGEPFGASWAWAPGSGRMRIVRSVREETARATWRPPAWRGGGSTFEGTDDGDPPGSVLWLRRIESCSKVARPGTSQRGEENAPRVREPQPVLAALRVRGRPRDGGGAIGGRRQGSRAPPEPRPTGAPARHRPPCPPGSRLAVAAPAGTAPAGAAPSIGRRAPEPQPPHSSPATAPPPRSGATPAPAGAAPAPPPLSRAAGSRPAVAAPAGGEATLGPAQQ
ncbi:unnamed protein product [Miscanthus lutarioriparius]|uniref:Uncharacterized protein n=1 Tax=Miscanthus lutarioriparius TaxID=422564 RepID=A0A811RDZ5_9POAL|nr:unnamed protein product [Miscanthus lutarioriparius]